MSNPGETAFAAWIRARLEVRPSHSSLTYFERMEHQCPTDVAGVYRPFDPARPEDWGNKTYEMAFIRPMGPDFRILDVGSGDGYPALGLAPYVRHVTGIDLSPRRVECCRRNAEALGIENVDFLEMSGESLEFADASFEGVVASSAIEQATDREAVLREIRRVLVPGGVLVANFQNFERELGGTDLVQVAGAMPDAYVYKVLRRDPYSEEVWCVALRDGTRCRAAFDEHEPDHMEGNLLDDPMEHPLGRPLLASLSDEIVCAERYEVRHFERERARDLLTAAGFVDVELRGDVRRGVRPVIERLADRGLLETLAPQFDEICNALSRIRPPDRSDWGGNLTVLGCTPA
jgi:SAM-dependent methyltransferase